MEILVSKHIFPALIAYSVSCCLAQDPPPLTWERQVPIEAVLGVAFDVLGNTVVTGYSEGMLPVVAYDVNGTLKWTYTGAGYGSTIATDLDGNVYVAGQVIDNGVNRPTVLRLSPSGHQQWVAVLPQESGTVRGGIVEKLVLDDEGVIYVSGNEGSPTDSINFVARIAPLTGYIEWIDRTPRALGSPEPSIATDGSGRLYKAVTTSATMSSISRLNPINGETMWSITIDDFYPLVAAGRNGDVIIVTYSGVVRKYTAEGQLVWIRSGCVPAGVSDIAVDREGNIYCSTQTGTAAVDPGGTCRWVVTGSPGPIALDRLGNIYVAQVTAGGIVKRSRDTGQPVWTITANALALGIDHGGGIVIGGQTGRIARYDQRYTDIPDVFRNSIDFRIDQASIWDPALPSFLFEEPFGDGPICWNSSGSCAESVFFDALDEGASGGLFGISAEADTSGQLQFGFRAEATGGSVDIDYPGTAELVIPNQSKWVVGRTVSIETSWTPSAGAGVKGRGKPTVNAGIVVSGHADLYANVRAWAPGVERTFINLDHNFNLNPATYLISILGLGGGVWQNGMWVAACDPAFYVCGEWRVPPLDINGSLENGRLTSQAVDRFIDLRGNLTQILSVNLLGIPTIAKFGRTAGGRPGREGPFEVSVEVSLIQAFIRAAFEAVQNISWEPSPKVRLVLSDPGFPSESLINLGDELEFPIPAGWDGTLEIRPEIVVDGAFRNQTGIRMIPTIGFEPIKAIGSISTGPLSLNLASLCLGCLETADPGLAPIFPYDRTFSMPGPTKRLPVINVTGTALENIWPVLTAASRETLPMVLYDQINPRQSSFNGIVNRTTKMLVYGNLFERGQDGDPDPVAFIRHAGAEAPLSTTWLNVNTLLVEIPNRFRLIPGVARLTVRTTVDHEHRYSNTIDLPIEYPIPNLATVNPNLWAADPALRTVPVSVIDGLSSAGNHTFIARRDYYLVLRDQLWNASTAGGVGAAAYFPDFDFNAMPGFPMVMFGGVPLSRFEQPIDNGIHNVRLPEASYAAPGVVDVFLENPPPVQGLSQTVRLNIAAPRPVISGFEPPTVPPGEAFTLIVKGPANVPFWQGYEEPKYGNFTAASVVLWDGVELPTTFIHSGALQVEVPQELVQQAGYHHITVETAAGGSVYFEQLRTGAGAIVWQGPVPSGCSINAAGDVLCGSDPMVFAVEYPQPFIENVGPSTVDACSASGPDQLSVDITIVGTGFAPDCRLFIDGAPRAVTRTSAELLQFTVASAEIAVPGVRSLYVENPGPYGGVSNEMTLEVVLTDCNANGRPDQCEINDGLAADCNGNRIPDSCDIAQGDSADMNGNGIPDECESGSPCRGDLDGDRDVDISDLAALLARFGIPGGATASDGDSDADGDVDLSDLSVLLGSFGAPCE